MPAKQAAATRNTPKTPMIKIAQSALALGIAFACLAPTAPAFAEETDTKVEKIETLLELTNADDLSTQVMENMVDQFRQSSLEVPDQWWDGFIEKANASDINALLIPIYDRNFTEAEIVAIIEFYESPAGQSVLAKMPLVVQESMSVGQAWGQSIAEELIRELEADGYEPRSI
ncbi:MAG: DUF2059 domain-containing protein [Cyanobacteria bacterium J06597_16]